MASSSRNQIPVFRPTMEEFKNFSGFIGSTEKKHHAHIQGIAKVVPPKEWIPRKAGYENINVKVTKPILQKTEGSNGLYTTSNLVKNGMLLEKFAELANSSEYRPKKCHEPEREFWRKITGKPPLYGADISGTITDKTQKIWNISHLGTILDEVLDVKIEGVNTAYLYFGMWRSSFAWHTEDMDLYSINYLHYGAPKFWYAIPPAHGKRFERMAAGSFPFEAHNCPAFLRHKTTQISPHILRQYSIPYNTITQNPGEFIITYPYCYHSGFNLGYNCAESTNFASERWIEYGKHCRRGSCPICFESVYIDMDPFVKRYQPERYDRWKAGYNDTRHPEDDQRKPYPKSTRTRIELPGCTDGRRGSYTVPRATDSSAKVVQVSRRIPVTRPVPNEMEVESCDRKTRKIPGKKRSARNEKPMEETSTHPEIGTETWNSEKQFVAKKLKSSRQGRASVNMETRCASLDQIDADLSSRVPQVEQGSCSRYSDPASGSMLVDHSYLPSNAGASNSSLLQLNAADLDIELDDLIDEDSDFSIIGDGDSILDGLMEETMKDGDWRQLQSSILLNQQSSDLVNRQSTDFVGQHSSVGKLSRHNKGADNRLDPVARSQMIDPKKSKRSVEFAQHLSHIKKSAPRLLPVAPLFQFLPVDQTAEINHNRTEMTVKPSCDICKLLTSSSKNSVSSRDIDDGRPIIPEELFRRSAKNLSSSVGSEDSSVPDTLSNNGSGGGSQQKLLVCSRCNLCVHSGCYGETSLSVPNSDWLCDRCIGGSFADSCCLCVLRGGALKRTSDGRWAHIVCALAIPEVHFEDVLHRRPINIEGVLSTRRKTKCSLCQAISGQQSQHQGACCRCSRCTTTFHVTCARSAGFRFEIGSRADERIIITCNKHEKQTKGSEKMQASIKVGDIVIAKHRNCRYYKCLVTSCSSNQFYRVAFEDGSFSNDTFPEDIQSHDVSSGPPPLNSLVMVKWTDGIMYKATFKGTNDVCVYQVQFEDGASLNVERKDIWSENEALPKRVSNKLSTAMESKQIFQDAYNKPQVDSRTRNAKLHFIRDLDFVCP